MNNEDNSEAFTADFVLDRPNGSEKTPVAPALSQMVATGRGSRYREVHSCRELLHGDSIEARRNGFIHFGGEVTETLSSMDLFWAVSASGERRIIEFSEFRVSLLMTD